MIRCSFNFNFNLNIIPKYSENKVGWCSTHIELGSRFGWNFFTRIHHWDKEMQSFLPPVTKFRFRVVEYYHEIQERVWDFVNKCENYYPKFEDVIRTEGGPTTRLIQVIYRLPLVTITNSYHTALDVQRMEEFRKELEHEKYETEQKMSEM